MAQQTAQSVMATPGKVHVWVAKQEAIGVDGPYYADQRGSFVAGAVQHDMFVSGASMRDSFISGVAKSEAS